MKIDFLLAVAYDPDPRVRREARALAAAGHEVRVLAWDRDGTRSPVEWDGRVQIERVAVRSRWGRGLTQIFFFARLLAAYLRLVRARRPDALHAVDLPMLCAALAIRPFVGRPLLVYDAFEIYSVMASRGLTPLVPLLRWLEVMLPRRADVVIAPGEIRQRWFARRGIRAITVPNWIDPPSQQPDRDVAREQLGLPLDRFVVAYVGGLLSVRDLDALLRHAERRPDDIAVFAGRGEDAARIEEAARRMENVRYLGWLRDPSVLLAAVDVLFYSLQSDFAYAALAAPNNLYSAIAFAVPLAYRPQGELRLIGERHRLGRVFDTDAELDAALDALREPELNASIRAELRGIRDAYAWSRAAETLLAAYAELARDGRGGAGAADAAGDATGETSGTRNGSTSSSPTPKGP